LLDLVRTLDTGFTNSFLQELGHFESNLEELSLLLVLFDHPISWVSSISLNERSVRVTTHLLELVSESRGKHVGEELECDREKEFHERDDEED